MKRVLSWDTSTSTRQPGRWIDRTRAFLASTKALIPVAACSWEKCMTSSAPYQDVRQWRKRTNVRTQYLYLLKSTIYDFFVCVISPSTTFFSTRTTHALWMMNIYASIIRLISSPHWQLSLGCMRLMSATSVKPSTPAHTFPRSGPPGGRDKIRNFAKEGGGSDWLWRPNMKLLKP